MVMTLHILHLEDSELDAELVRHALQSGELQCQVDWVDDFSTYRQALVSRRYDLILSDFSLPDCDGLKALSAAQEAAPDTPFLLVTGALGEELAIDTIRAGVTDYVLKTNLVRLPTAVLRAAEEASNQWERKQAIAALTLSEKRFDLAVRGSGAGIWDWEDVSIKQMWWSPRIYEMLGFENGAIPASRAQLYSMILEQDIALVKQGMQKHLTEQIPYDVEFRIRHKLGHYIWLRSRGQAIFNAVGKPERMAGYIQDISDRKVAQEALRAREADLLRAQSIAHIGSWLLDLATHQLSWTDETFRIFGVKDKSDFAGTVEDFFSRVHPADHDLVATAWKKALEGGSYDIEHRILLPNNEVCIVREVAEILYDHSGKPFRAVGVVHDLTRQRQAEADQRKADEKYRIITRAAREAIVMVDSAARVTFWNPAAEKIFGYNGTAALGRDIHQMLAPEERFSEISQGLAAFSVGGKGCFIGQTVEVTALRQDGTEVPVEISLNSVFHDEEWQAIAVVRDISERRDAEVERRSLEKQLQQTQKMEALGTLAGGIAHDFNNILASILGYSAMAGRRMPEGSQEQKDLQEVLKAAERAKQLVRQILTFSREHSQEKEPVHLDLVIKEVLQLIRASLPATIDIKVSMQAEGDCVLGSSTQIHQVVMNLCTNAYHAMPDGGVLSVDLRKKSLSSFVLAALTPGDYLQLLVSDTGCGIAPEHVDKIFDPYFTTKDVDSGTGLGLSVVHGIVTGLGGYVGVKSTLGEGACFQVLLPCYQEERRATQRTADVAVPGGAEHILFVDDEIGLAQLGQNYLSQLGYQVTIQTSSLTALEKVVADPDKYDLVITDQTMPKMTGLELAKQLKRVAPDLPVILCSGLKYSLETEGVSETSICRFLMKTEMIERLPYLLRGIFDS